jgi:hypothetical protein
VDWVVKVYRNLRGVPYRGIKVQPIDEHRTRVVKLKSGYEKPAP